MADKLIAIAPSNIKLDIGETKPIQIITTYETFDIEISPEGIIEYDSKFREITGKANGICLIRIYVKGENGQVTGEDYATINVSGDTNTKPAKIMLHNRNTNRLVTLEGDNDSVDGTLVRLSRTAGTLLTDTNLDEFISVINTPTIVSPDNGTENYEGLIKASDFSLKLNLTLEHTHSVWQYARDKDFNNIITEVTKHKAGNNVLTEISSKYTGIVIYVRVKYCSDDIESNWSDSIRIQCAAHGVEAVANNMIGGNYWDGGFYGIIPFNKTNSTQNFRGNFQSLIGNNCNIFKPGYIVQFLDKEFRCLTEIDYSTAIKDYPCDIDRKYFAPGIIIKNAPLEMYEGGTITSYLYLPAKEYLCYVNPYVRGVNNEQIKQPCTYVWNESGNYYTITTRAPTLTSIPSTTTKTIVHDFGILTEECYTKLIAGETINYWNNGNCFIAMFSTTIIAKSTFTDLDTNPYAAHDLEIPDELKNNLDLVADSGDAPKELTFNLTVEDTTTDNTKTNYTAYDSYNKNSSNNPTCNMYRHYGGSYVKDNWTYDPTTGAGTVSTTDLANGHMIIAYNKVRNDNARKFNTVNMVVLRVSGYPSSVWSTTFGNHIPTVTLLLNNIGVGAGIEDNNIDGYSIDNTSIGAITNTDTPWLKFVHKGKLFYTPQKPPCEQIAWTDLAKRDVVYGNRTIRLRDRTYKIRLLTEEEYINCLLASVSDVVTAANAPEATDDTTNNETTESTDVTADTETTEAAATTESTTEDAATDAETTDEGNTDVTSEESTTTTTNTRRTIYNFNMTDLGALDNVLIEDFQEGGLRNVMNSNGTKTTVDPKSRTCVYRPVLEYIADGDELYNNIPNCLDADDDNFIYDKHTDTGYFGTVSASRLFTCEQVSAAVGFTTGTVPNNTMTWFKFYWHGMVLFIQGNVGRYGAIGLNTIKPLGFIYSADMGDGLRKELVKNGIPYKLRITTGLSSAPHKTFTSNANNLYSGILEGTMFSELLRRVTLTFADSVTAPNYCNHQIGDNWTNVSVALNVSPRVIFPEILSSMATTIVSFVGWGTNKNGLGTNTVDGDDGVIFVLETPTN